MSKIALSYEEVMALKPCSEEFERVTRLLGGEGWNGRKIDAATARAAGCTLGDLFWVAAAVAEDDPDVDRRLRLWAADCAAHVLHIYEQSETSDAPRNAIIATRQYARGEIDDDAREAARDTAWDTASGIAWARSAAWAAAWSAAWAAAWAVALDATMNAAWSAVRAAVRDAVRDAAWDAARDTEKEWQLDRLVAWLSDNEPEDWPLPARQEAEGRAP